MYEVLCPIPDHLQVFIEFHIHVTSAVFLLFIVPGVSKRTFYRKCLGDLCFPLDLPVTQYFLLFFKLFEVLHKLHVTFPVVHLSLRTADLFRMIPYNRVVEKRGGEVVDMEGSPPPSSRVVRLLVQYAGNQAKAAGGLHVWTRSC